MKWVTREKARVDRIACPWPITRFIDKAPVFLFVPADQVMEYRWANERMSLMHEEAARRALVRSLRPAYSLRFAHTLIRLGGRVARRATHRQAGGISSGTRVL